MELIDRSALVPYTAAEMFALVSDIDTYPAFLPWCSDAQIIERAADGVTARIEFAVRGVKKSFTTRNVHSANEQITMQLVEGPFSSLQGRWLFTPLGDAGCKISLHLEYDFSSKVVQLATAPVFGQIANSLVDAFQQRAVAVYGER